MTAEQGILFDFPPSSKEEIAAMRQGLAEIPEHQPYDAIEVLEDNQFHAVLSPGVDMYMDDYSPITFWINGKAEQPLEKLEYPSSGPGYRLVFQRNIGSWAREGLELSCKGIIIVNDRELPAKLITFDDNVFFHKLNEPQQPSWPLRQTGNTH